MANCVKCGADLQHGALKCEYCGSAVDILKAAEPAGAGAAGNFGAPGAVAPKFKIVSIGMMILLVVVTFGLYVSGWFFARRRKFRELSPKGKNTPAAFGALLTVHIIYLFVLLGHFGGENPAETAGVVSMTWWCLWGTLIYASTVARSCLAELRRDYAGSMIWTVLLTCFYLQSQINAMIDARVLNAEV